MRVVEAGKRCGVGGGGWGGVETRDKTFYLGPEDRETVRFGEKYLWIKTCVLLLLLLFVVFITWNVTHTAACL